MKKSFTEKLRELMRICAVQAMVAVFLCGVTLAHSNYAQLLDQEISVTIDDLSFEEALKQIGDAAKVKFAYSVDHLAGERHVSLSVDKHTLRDVLEELLTPRHIRYKVHDRESTITLMKMTENDRRHRSFRSEDIHEVTAHPLPISVSGIVRDGATQIVMPGVNVLVKGSTRGTTTDADGRYALAAEDNDILVFSFIGYASVEVTVNERTVIDVAMAEDALSLNEVIVNAGYWTVKDQERTGNISRIAATEIQKQPVSNPLQALQGRMTGVYIQQTTGVPGGAFKIQVRGQNSLRTGSDGLANGNLPLYLVDGVPMTSTSLSSRALSGSSIAGGNPLSAINPNDIESIEVLKDADATAIYGSRGANGVVLITTKRASAGKPKIDLDLYHGIGQVSNFMDLLSAGQYLEMRREAFKNDSVAPSATNAPDLLAWDTTRYTHWQKELIGGTGHITNGQISFSGGSEKTQFLLSGGYYRETTVFPGDNFFQRASGRMSVRHQSDDRKLNIESAINYSSSFSSIPSTDFTGPAISLAPVAPALFDDNGNLNWENSTWTNPLASMKREYESNTDNLVTNVSLSYEVLPGLNIKSDLGYTSMYVNEHRTNPLSAVDPSYAAFRTGSANFGDGRLKTWIVEPHMDYTRKLGAGVFTVLIGSTFQQSIATSKTMEGSGYTNDAFLENLRAAGSIRVSENTYSDYKYAAVFARLNYSWKEKYILNLTGRRDGSSRFGPGRRFADFGAAGAAWIFSNEPFAVEHLSFLSFGKIRTSYGTTGSDAIGNYQFLETYSPTVYPYAGSSGLVLTRLANPDYSWETNKKFESGVELGFWKDRVTFSGSYYLNRATGQLVGLPLPVITGQSSVQFNLPATVQNRGWEFQLSTINIKTDQVRWSTNFNITLPENQLIAFPDLEKFPSYMSRYDVGKSVYIYKAYQSAGVDPQTGLYTIVDLDNDASVSSPGDLIGLKTISQSFYGGVGSTLAYERLELDLFLQFVKQTGMDYKQSFGVPGWLSNQPQLVMERWQRPGDHSTIERFAAVDPTASVIIGYYNNVASDDAVGDASFIRLKNVSLSYHLPSRWTKKLKMEGSRIYVQGQNLLTITRYSGLDPETQSSQLLPPLRILTFGIQITL